MPTNTSDAKLTERSQAWRMRLSAANTHEQRFDDLRLQSNRKNYIYSFFVRADCLKMKASPTLGRWSHVFFS